MTRLRIIRKAVSILNKLMIVLLGTLFGGVGANQVLQWFGQPVLTNFNSSMVGFILVTVCYILPMGIHHLIVLRKIAQYYPVTNEVLREHRTFFIENINQEIAYLEQAVNAFKERGLRDDFNVFFEGLQTMKEIKSRIIVNEELQREHLKCLNQVFNREYLMKKL